MARLALASGRGKSNSLSNRPGLRSAESMASGRFVAPITTTYSILMANNNNNNNNNNIYLSS